MRKLHYLFFLLAVPAMLTFTGCGDDKDKTVEPGCGTGTFPATSGTSSVSFLNYPDNLTNDPNSDGIIDITAASGDVLSFAVQINKGVSGNRPQKLRVYSTECENNLGSIVSFSGTTVIDLRNDDQQVKNVNYTVPSGVTTTYLNFEVDESSGKLTYKRVKLNVTGSGIVSSYTGIVLGDQGATAPSRMVSATGLAYTTCNAIGNINDVDITYAVSKTFAAGGTCATQTQNLSYISDNPTRFTCPVGLSVNTVPCGDDNLSAGGGPSVYYKNNSTVDFANVTDAQLSALTVSSSDPRAIQVTTVGQVIEFLTTDGRKGLIKVTAASGLNTTGNTITVDVKVQR